MSVVAVLRRAFASEPTLDPDVDVVVDAAVLQRIHDRLAQLEKELDDLNDKLARRERALTDVDKEMNDLAPDVEHGLDRQDIEAFTQLQLRRVDLLNITDVARRAVATLTAERAALQAQHAQQTQRIAAAADVTELVAAKADLLAEVDAGDIEVAAAVQRVEKILAASVRYRTAALKVPGATVPAEDVPIKAVLSFYFCGSPTLTAWKYLGTRFELSLSLWRDTVRKREDARYQFADAFDFLKKDTK